MKCPVNSYVNGPALSSAVALNLPAWIHLSEPCSSPEGTCISSNPPCSKLSNAFCSFCAVWSTVGCFALSSAKTSFASASTFFNWYKDSFVYSPFSASSARAINVSSADLSVSPKPRRSYLFDKNSVLESIKSCDAFNISFPSEMLSSNASFSSCGAFT